MTTTVRTNDTSAHPQMPLHGWLPIAEVAEHLGMKRDTVYHAVINAAELKQDWVKQEAYPSPGGPRRWLVNTDSEIFQYHERRWKRLMEKQQERTRKLSSLAALPDFPFGMDDEDENPLDRQEDEEDTASSFAWQSPFALTDPFTPIPPPPVFPKAQAEQTLWKRGMVELSLLVLLQLVTIACIVKRIPEQDRPH